MVSVPMELPGAMMPSTLVLPSVPMPFSRPLAPTVVVPPLCVPLKETTPPLTTRLLSFSTPLALIVLTPPVVFSAVETIVPLSRNWPFCTSTAEVRALLPFNSSVPSRSTAPLKLLPPLRRSQPMPDLVSLPGPVMSLVQSSQASPSQTFRPPAFWFITTSVSTRSEP
ncbi:hypothetical protein SRABI81_03442 [Stenotrophomonas lactitubi]|nr:hypothetical protein SRABI81_03442 [Stenotrophomonas lactitubi]